MAHSCPAGEEHHAQLQLDLPAAATSTARQSRFQKKNPTNIEIVPDSQEAVG